jgi:hypothetical protein
MGEGKIFELGGVVTGTFAAGVSAEALSINYDIESTTEEIKNTFATKVFPNPTKSKLNIESEFPIEDISIINLLNQKVKNWKVNMDLNQTIDLFGLPNGVYILQLSSSKGTVTKKIVKE